MTKERMNETRKLFLELNEGNIYMQNEKTLGKGAGAYNFYYSCYKLKSSKYYHFELKGNSKGNRWSTGKTKKPEAIRLVDSIIHNAMIQRQSLTFEKFTEYFFIPGKCSHLMNIDSDEEEILDSTIKKNRSILDKNILPFFKNMEISQISISDFQRWKIEIRKKYAYKTMLNFKSILNTIFDEAVEEGHIIRNPLPKAKKGKRKKKSSAKKEREAFTKDEINMLFPETEAGIKQVWNEYQYYAMYLTMLTAGIRPGEVRALKWSDFWLDVHVIDVNKCINGDLQIAPPKNNQYRSVPIPEETVRVLNKLKSMQKWNSDDDYIFKGMYRNKAISQNVVSRHIRAALIKHLGIDKPFVKVAHSFRHTQNTWLLQYTNIDFTQSMTGHRTGRMTNSNYNHPEDFRKSSSIYLEKSAVVSKIWNERKI